MPEGKVKWFSGQKGYGFIQRDEGKDLFVHITDIEAEEGAPRLEEGEAVTFEVEEGPKGPQAKHVRRKAA